MRLRVRYIGSIGSIAGTRQDTLEIPEASSIQDVLNELKKRHGEEFVAELLSNQGALREGIEILLNGRNVRDLQSLDTKISNDEDELQVIAMLFMTSGG